MSNPAHIDHTSFTSPRTSRSLEHTKRKDDAMLALWTQILMGRFNRSQEGQGTVEYVLVILGVAAVALILISWVRGQGGGVFSTLFNKVLGFVMGKIGF